MLADWMSDHDNDWWSTIIVVLYLLWLVGTVLYVIYRAGGDR